MDEPIDETNEPQTEAVQNGEAVDPTFTFSFDLRKALISSFILWQMFAVFVWLIPDGLANYRLSPIVSPYMRVTGFWQAWTMFSPNPMKDDYFVQAQIKYADGTTRDWNIPRMHDMGLIQKYQKERWRKMIENAGWKSNKAMYPYLARYAMIENDRGPKTYPATVTLVRYWRYITPPNPGWRTPDFAPTPFAMYTYTGPVLQDEAHS